MLLQMMLAQKYTKQDPAGMLVSEKMDGCRAFWDGHTLRTRSWLPVHCPSRLTASLPKGIALDGELWMGRQTFQKMRVLVQTKRANDPLWASVRYMVFDAPTCQSIPLEERLATAKALALGEQVFFVEQAVIPNEFAMWHRFQEVVAGGGEGLVLRRAGSFYDFERSNDWLKVKPCNVD